MVINSIRDEMEHGECRIVRAKSIMDGIASAGYDALCAILELEFAHDGQVWRFYDVPEHVWYEWRRSEKTSVYFHTYISGRYVSRQIRAGSRQYEFSNKIKT